MIEERITCDCGCGALMAMRRGDKLVIRRNEHILVLSARALDEEKALAVESRKSRSV